MSRITLHNRTEDVIRLAIYKRPVIGQSQAIIAWRIAAPPPGRSQPIEIPEDFSVIAGYADDFSATTFKAAQESFTETSRFFLINPEDQHPSGVRIQQSSDGVVPAQVRVFNNLQGDALVTIANGGDAIYEKQLITPGGLFMEDIRPSFCLAVVSQFILKGQHLIPDELALTQIPIPHEGVISVTGSLWDGYELVSGQNKSSNKRKSRGTPGH